MNEQTNLTERGNDAETATAATKIWGPMVFGIPGGAMSQSLTQGAFAAAKAKHLANLGPDLRTKTLKIHGIPELNSPLAGKVGSQTFLDETDFIADGGSFFVKKSRGVKTILME